MNITRGLFGSAVASVALVLQALPAAAEPGFGPLIDEFCTQQGRVPATPYADGVGSVPQQECQLCHQPGTFDASNNNAVQPNFREFELARLSGDYRFFCSGLLGGNTAPVLEPIGDRSVRAGSPLVFDVRASDVNGDPLLLGVTGLPDGARFSDRGNGSGELSWTPLASQIGEHHVVFIVVDSAEPEEGTDAEEIKIWVGENRPPVLDPVGSQSGRVGVPIRLELRALDADRDPLSFSVSDAPPGSLLTDRGDGTAEWSWLPGPDQSGNFSVTFEVTDAWDPPAGDSEQVVLSIGPVNRPPVLAPIGDRRLDAGTPVVVALSASDPDRNRLAFSVSGAPASARLADRGDGTAEWSWQPAPGWAGVMQVEFSVTDDGDPRESASESVAISVMGVDLPPELAPIGDRRARVGEPLVIPISARDPEGGVLVFAAPGLPVGAVLVELGGGRAELQWTPSPDQVGVWPMVVAVADLVRATDSEAFQVTVEPAIVAPLPGDLKLLWASWSRGDARLLALGRGAAPGETVSLVDVGTGALLAVERANRRGAFQFGAAPFLAPCAVRVRVQAGDSAPFAVVGAPRDCGRKVLTQVRAVSWECHRAELRIRAKRVPASGSLEIRDAATGALLGTAAADHRGRVDARLALPSAPGRVRLGVRAGQAHWDLGSFQVRGASFCGHRHRHGHGHDRD